MVLGLSMFYIEFWVEVFRFVENWSWEDGREFIGCVEGDGVNKRG